MKVSAYHKQLGHTVEWYDPIKALTEGEYDLVRMSKVFTFTPDYDNIVYAKHIIKGGTGYYYPSGGDPLPYDIEHIYPDYDLYGIKDTAYGFLTRGCPKGNIHKYCIVSVKEGYCSQKVADLSEFWRGQKNIVLLDPNITASKDCIGLFEQLVDSKAWIDFSQGLDMQLMTPQKAELIKQMKIKQIHFALDNWDEIHKAIPKFKAFKDITGWDKRKMGVYVLTNYDTTHEQDLERIYLLRDLGYWPYVMVYNKEQTKSTDLVRKVQRWVNARPVFEKISRFEDYVAQ